MFVTIWMCTQEWSLISIRATAFTFATCHQRLQLVVAVDALDQRAQLPVAAHRHVDPHPRDRLGRRQPGLALGLRGDRLVDPARRSPRCPIAMAGSVRRDPASCTSAGSVMNACMDEHPVRLVVEDDLQRQPADGLLPAAPRDPALHLGRSSGRSPSSSRRSSAGSRRSSPGGCPAGCTGSSARTSATRRTSSRTSASSRNPYPAFSGERGRLPDRRRAARRRRRSRAGRRSSGSSSRSRRSLLSAALGGRRAAASRYGDGAAQPARYGSGGALGVAVRVPRLVREPRTGRMPRGLRDAGAYGIGYRAQMLAYLLLVTDRYPNADPTAMLAGRRAAAASTRCTSSATPHDLRRSRVTVFFRLPLAIPHLVWLVLWAVARVLAVIVQWFVTLFAGTPAAALHRFLVARTCATRSTSTRSCTSPRTRSRASPAQPGALPARPRAAGAGAARTAGRRSSASSSRIPAFVVNGGARLAPLSVAAILTWFVALVTRPRAVGPAEPLRLRAALRRRR